MSFINSSVENLDQSPFESIDNLVEDVNKYDLKSPSDEQQQQQQQELQTQNLKHKPSFTSTPKASYIPPWTEPYIIGIAGNSGSGKTSISQKSFRISINHGRYYYHLIISINH